MHGVMARGMVTYGTMRYGACPAILITLYSYYYYYYYHHQFP